MVRPGSTRLSGFRPSWLRQLSGSSLSQNPAVRRQKVLQAVAQDWRALCGYPDFWGDREIMWAAVGSAGDGWQALEIASEDLRGDRELVLKAVAQHWEALKMAALELRSYKEVVMTASAQHWQALNYAGPECKANREVLWVAVGSNAQGWRALGLASEELRRDRGLVMRAAAQHWQALRFADPELLRDREVLLAALGSNAEGWRALGLADDCLLRDRGLILRAAAHNWQALSHAAPELLADRGVLLAALGSNAQGWRALEFATTQLAAAVLSDEEIAARLQGVEGSVLRVHSPAEEFFSEEEEESGSSPAASSSCLFVVTPADGRSFNSLARDSVQKLGLEGLQCAQGAAAVLRLGGRALPGHERPWRWPGVPQGGVTELQLELAPGRGWGPGYW